MLSILACRFANVPLSKVQPSAVQLSETPTLTVTPQPSLTPSPTIIPSPTPFSCTNGDCVSSCYRQLAPIVSPGELRDHRAIREVDNEDGYSLVNYVIKGDSLKEPVEGDTVPDWLKPYQQDQKAQQEIWNYFALLIPDEQRKFLTEYHIFSDGEDNILASVVQTETDMNSWALEVDILDAAYAQDLTATLIHEFAHLVSLNPDQVIPSKRIFDNPDNYDIYDGESYACKTYFPGEGCSLEDSYINTYYDKFWVNIEPEWLALDELESDDEYYAGIDRLYKKYQDQFVTDYAATNTSEDFAEAFTVFILEPKPEGSSIADQKVRFFYEYPEFVQLREHIGRALCGRVNK